MRSFLIRFRWLILGIALLALVGTAIVLAGGRSVRSAAERSTQPTATGKLDAYRGLGTWVDLWDAKAWRDPAAAVRDMASHGVHTIFVQTGTARSAKGIANPAALAEFITEAHARGMYVVAWYLPTLKADAPDFDRVVQAIEFTTAEGQKVDSFALDIESTAVKRLSVRNASLAELSARIRDHVGPDYPLGGIIPSPVGLRKQTGFWNVFPYQNVAETYDVLLPMAYYTYHGHTAAQARADAQANVRLLREQPGCSDKPVHLIGGISGKPSTTAEARAFSRAARDVGCIGASLYDWAGMTPGQWRAMSAVWGSGAR
jgi:hypothetical protein